MQQAIGQDWQNDYARFSTSLKQELGRIRSEERRQKAIEEMRRVLETYTGFKHDQNSGRER